MYHCTDCGSYFEKPLKFREGDYAFGELCETTYLCPKCKSSYIKNFEPEYCHCCGRKLTRHQHIYCSRACLKNGEIMYSNQRQRAEKLRNSPIYVIVRQLKEYNEKHKTNLTYGQFAAGGYV